MIWTAWNNGKHHPTGIGYGFKVSAADRDRYFNPAWQTVILELPSRSGPVIVEANVGKESFWNSQCRELISKEIGRWLIEEGCVLWPKGNPPKFIVEPCGDRRFHVQSRVV
jgi:hypothetical protein